MSDAHSHDHAGRDSGGHAGHAHGVSADADTGKLAIALGLILGFMVIEVLIGVLAHPLALLSDAGHMLTDAAAIAFSLIAMKLAARPAKGARPMASDVSRFSPPRLTPRPSAAD